jgi:ankyrin repeat protein
VARRLTAQTALDSISAAILYSRQVNPKDNLIALCAVERSSATGSSDALKGHHAAMKCKPFLVFALVLSLFSLFGCKPTPASLMTAVKANQTEEAKSLIGKGADANSRTSPSGWSALHYAARNGNVEIVQALLSAGADAGYAGTMEGQTGPVVSVKPLEVAQGTLNLVGEIPAASMEETLRQGGVNDPVLLKSMKDSTAADRYQKVVDLLTKAAKGK